MKRRWIRGAILLLLAAGLLPGAHCARAGGLIEALGTPAPAAAVFDAGGFHIELPRGLEPLAGEALAGYEAAVLSDYPGAARTLLAAANADRSSAVLAACIDSGADCLDAAREAAGALLRYPDAARELCFGENRCAGFGCAIGEQAYRLYFFADGARVLLVATAGLESDALDGMLSGLRM